VTEQTDPFRGGSFMILSFDHRTSEQLIPFTPSFSDTIAQVSYSDQAEAEEQARTLAERAPSYLTFAVIQIQQVAKVAGVRSAGQKKRDPYQDMAKRLEGLPWG
jgi:hypothetical protein